MDWSATYSLDGLDPDTMTDCLRTAIRTSETAVLEIGRLLDQIVTTATLLSDDNRDQREANFTARIKGVMTSAAAFIEETRVFLRRQIEFAAAANDAFRRIYTCSNAVAGLMRRSHLLALNMQIESARLSLRNTAFHVIGVEMAQFAGEVRGANTRIVEALDELSQSLPNIATEANAMGSKATAFAHKLGDDLHTLDQQVSAQRAAQAEALARADDRNRKIIGLSHRTLSALQFQDPMAQALEGVISLLQGTPAKVLSATLTNTEEDTGGGHERVPGELELF